MTIGDYGRRPNATPLCNDSGKVDRSQFFWSGGLASPVNALLNPDVQPLQLRP
jgi:hypothetical protein